MAPTSGPVDVRDVAREAARGTASTSAVQAAGGVVATATVAGVVGTGLAAVGAFSVPVFVALATMTAASYPLWFGILEIMRLRRSHRLLGEVLDSERIWETLLSDVRQERDNLLTEVHRLRVSEDVTRGVQGLLEDLRVREVPARKRAKRKEPDDG